MRLRSSRRSSSRRESSWSRSSTAKNGFIPKRWLAWIAVELPAVEPRTFSFNSVYGACETCHGLGVRFDFDPSRIAVDPSRPLLQGGLVSTNTWLDDELEVQVRRVAEQLNIDLAAPFDQLPEKDQQAPSFMERQ